MRDELEAPFLDEWLRDTEVTPPDPKKAARQVASRLPRTRQVGRWLPFPVSRRKAHSPTTTDTTEYQPGPIPATNGHTPTVIGRTTSMLSPVKAITAGALVFALGGAFLIAQPFEQQGNAPGAETEPPIVAPVEVTGTSAAPAGCGSASRDGSVELDGVGFSLFQCSTERGMPWTFSDPRLEGTVTRLVEEVYIGLDELPEIYSLCLDEPDCDYYSAPEELYVGRTSFSIENEDGAWRERPRNWVMGWSDDEGLVLDGEGAYDGLVAVLRTTGPNKEFRGFIMDARLLPPPPENASAK